MFTQLISFLVTTLTIVSCSSMPLGLESSRQIPINQGVLQVASRGMGHPTVVFETGAGSEMGVWTAVINRVSPLVSTFAYNRPGYGTSRVHRSPRSIHEVVNQLRQGLQAAGHQPPYLLVGHSLGGLYMNYFARTFPEEVIGLVLVDSSHPHQFEMFREEMPWAHSILLTSYGLGPLGRRYELTTMEKAQQEFSQAPPFPSIPVVVLTAGEVAAWESEESRALWLRLQGELTGMSPLGTQVVAENSGHFIQRSEPELIVRAIHDILNINS